MFARTLLALTLCAGPVLAAPPEAPMPRAIPTTFSPHEWHLWWDEDAAPPAARPMAMPAPPHPMWYDPEVCPPDALRQWHQMSFDALRSTVYGPFVCTQNLREDVFQLAAEVAPLPRAVGELPPKYSVWDLEVYSPEEFQLWHRMNFSSAYNAPFRSYQAQRDIVTRRALAYGVSFSCQRDQAYRETEYMKRYQEPLRFATQPLAAREDSEPASDVFSEKGRACLPSASAAVDPRLVPTRTGQVLFFGSANSDLPVCPPCPLPKIEVNPLLGTWYREVPGCVACATFTHDELKLTFAESDGTKHTATAQYTVTKDGLVFGAITGTSGPASLVDVPFSFRFRVTSDGVMVSAFKSEPMGDTARFCGLFKSAKDGKVPAPVAAKPALGAAVGTGLLPPNAGSNIGAPLIDPVRPASLETPPAVLPPVLDGPPPVPPARPKGSPPPDGLKGFADDAFGEMLRQSGVLPKPELDSMTLPSARYLEHYPRYFGPDPVFPLPRELATVEATPAKKLAHVGTWHRDLGPMTCVVKIDAEHVTITATVSGEENGKKVKQGVVMTGDYHLARDGTTLVGLVTGLDVIVEGLTSKETESLMGLEEVAKMQKALMGQPFALGVRAYGDVLVIGDVRVGHASERGIEEASAMVSGRYKSGEPKAAEPKRLPGANVPRIPMADADAHAGVKELLLEGRAPNIEIEWRWFQSEPKPQHLTPERIHGGIY